MTDTEKLKEFLQYLIDQREGYRKPVAYQDDVWYIRCEAKADMLDDIIGEFKALMKGQA